MAASALQLRAAMPQDTIRERWAGCQLDHRAGGEHGLRDGKPFSHVPTCFITPCAQPKAMLRLVRTSAGQSKTSGTWPRDTQLGEDATAYAQRNGVQVAGSAATLAFNLLRCNGFRSSAAWPDGPWRMT